MEHANVMQTLARPETRFTGKTAKGESMEFRIIHWSPSKVFSRISLVGKYFYVPASMLIGTEGDSEAFAEALPAALLHLFNTMEEKDFIHFIATMLDEVMYQNKSVVQEFDKVFLGKNEVVIQLIAKVLEVNYAPFFSTGFESLLTSILPVTSLHKPS